MKGESVMDIDEVEAYITKQDIDFDEGIKDLSRLKDSSSGGNFEELKKQDEQKNKDNSLQLSSSVLEYKK